MTHVSDQARSTLGTLLRSAYRKLAISLYDELGRQYQGVRLTHSAVLRSIEPDGSRVVDLAAAAGMTKQSMAYLVEQLVDLGYLEVGPDPRDGRAKLVKLTRAGEELYAAAVALSARLERGMADALGERDARELRRILERVHDEWHPDVTWSID